MPRALPDGFAESFADMRGLPWIIDCESHPVDIHVMPLEDYVPHNPSINCWCRPERDYRELTNSDGEIDVVVHNAMDRRDQYLPDGGHLHLH